MLPFTMSPTGPSRRAFLKASVVASALPALVKAAPAPPFELDEVTITELQNAMKGGKLTARSLAEKYLARIEAIDRQGPTLRSILEINPDVLAIADGLDRERKQKGARGQLHG